MTASPAPASGVFSSGLSWALRRPAHSRRAVVRRDREGMEEDEGADVGSVEGLQLAGKGARGWRAVFRRREYIFKDILTTRYILDGLSRHPSMVVFADHMLASVGRLSESIDLATRRPSSRVR